MINNDIKLKLKTFQEKQTEIVKIYEKNYYDIYFTVVETKEEFFVLFKLYGEILRLIPQEEINYIVNSFASAYSVMTYKIKMIITSDYLNLDNQIDYWEKKRETWEKKENELILKFIDEKINQLHFYQRNALAEEYYCKVFGNTEKEVLKNAFLFADTFGSVITPVPIRKDSLQKIMRKEHNPLERKEMKT
jgi:hypothetical protein